ncbi:MAG: hypothetical protein M1819_001725 [Sarea resinae]|nr:MAG: hypothetical protein M1819_001725 [Sarea resinae]
MPLFYPRRRPRITSPWDPPSQFDLFLISPLKYIAQQLYVLLLFLRGPPRRISPSHKPIRIVCISDTHNRTIPVPDGHLLIHAGDLSDHGSVAEIQAQIDWLKGLPHAQKVVIAGNHDSYFDESTRKQDDKDKELNWGSIHYLQHSSVSLNFPTHDSRRLNIYGAPHIPNCGGSSFAFQYMRGDDAWSNTIPDETDVLVTHTPPKYHLDLPAALGCQWLLKEVWRVRPTVHVCGHIHAGRGQQSIFWDEGQRAYERICARRQPSMFGDFFSPSLWIDAFKVLYYGIVGLLWSRIWGGSDFGGHLVNAAAMNQSTGQPNHEVIVVEV